MPKRDEPDICSHCGQIIPPKQLFTHQPVKQRIYDYVVSHPGGVTTQQIMDFIYADDPDGGAEYNTVKVHIYFMNRLLRLHGLQLYAPKGRGSSYTLQKAGYKTGRSITS